MRPLEGVIADPERPFSSFVRLKNEPIESGKPAPGRERASGQIKIRLYFSRAKIKTGARIGTKELFLAS